MYTKTDFSQPGAHKNALCRYNAGAAIYHL